jgi:hypothetical protein
MVTWPTVALLVTAGAFALGQSTKVKFILTSGEIIPAAQFINQKSTL